MPLTRDVIEALIRAGADPGSVNSSVRDTEDAGCGGVVAFEDIAFLHIGGNLWEEMPPENVI